MICWKEETRSKRENTWSKKKESNVSLTRGIGNFPRVLIELRLLLPSLLGTIATTGWSTEKGGGGGEFYREVLVRDNLYILGDDVGLVEAI